MLERIQRLINNIAKGMIYGNVLVSNGGGVYIETALMERRATM